MASSRALAGVGVVLLTYGLRLPAQGPAEGRPPLEGWRLGGEVIAGMYAGYAGYFAGRFVGTHFSDAVLRGDGHSTARGRIKDSFGFAVGGVATAGAVFGVGSLQNQTASFPTTMLGAGIGFGTALAIKGILSPRPRVGESSGTRAARRVGEFVQVLLPSIGATVGFNSTRKRR